MILNRLGGPEAFNETHTHTHFVLYTIQGFDGPEANQDLFQYFTIPS